MKTKLTIPLLIITIMTLLSCTERFQRAPIITLEDFFKNPEKTYYKISPDGEYLSFMSPYENRMNIHVQRMGSDSVTQLTAETDRDIAWYIWANEKRILYLKDDGGNENFKLYGVDIDGSNLKCLTDFEDVRTTIIDDLENIPDYMIIGLNKRDATVFDPYRININTGDLEMLAENPGNIVGWMTDHDGKLRIAYAITGGINRTILYRETEQDDFNPVLTTSYKDNFNPQFFTFDNSNIYASSNIGRDKMIIIEYDPKAGKEVDTLFTHDEVDVTRLHFSRKRKVITAATYYTTKLQRHFFDDKTKNMFDKLDEELGIYEVGIAGYDRDEQKFIVRTYSDRSRGAYYYFDYENDILEKIHDISPWLEEKHLAEMVPVEYKSRDGLTIHGYLTLPTDVKPKTLPVVVHPHGGPWARDRWGFNPEVQFLANRGYAVLHMNFRGSTGYGKEFWLKSMKQWGKTMQDDITDGVEWIIQQGIADRDRIAIYGGSYGGYATLAGLAFTPDIYTCGVDYVGVSNIFTFMKTIPPYWEPLREMWYEMVGDPVEDSMLLAEVSPVMHADKITAPLFVAQGANDPRVNKAESDQMVEAIRARGIEVEYMVKDDEGHGFRNEENRFDFYHAMEKFLATHIGDSIQ